ncbi:MAG TPA: alpha/beta fold hydrolase [Cyclobacteriaceae bacterium]|nr:alpha/beta fold hydrolase [Cyclobacteriaceae bacterium]
MNPLLILHGALGSASQLDPVKNAFENRVVHTLNFSGHGGVAFQTDFGIQQFADDAFQYLQRHQLKQVDIFGYSMGGYVALWLAKNYPDRVGKIVTLGTKFDWNEESATKEVKKLNPEKILEKIPAFARILEHRHAPNDWKELLNKTADMMLSLGKKPLLTKEILETINHQTIICLGDQDDMADRSYSEDVAGFLPNGQFRLLENTPHPIEKVDLKKLSL